MVHIAYLQAIFRFPRHRCLDVGLAIYCYYSYTQYPGVRESLGFKGPLVLDHSHFVRTSGKYSFFFILALTTYFGNIVSISHGCTDSAE